MKTNHKRDLTPPKNWQDFEDLCLGLWRPRLVDVKKNGRTGQPQAGVDIFGRDPETKAWCGIQCKKKDRWPEKELKSSEIQEEIDKAEGFEPPLSHFIVATTAPRDAKLQTFVRKLSVRREREGKFSVDLYAWDDLQEWLEEGPEALSRAKALWVWRERMLRVHQRLMPYFQARKAPLLEHVYVELQLDPERLRRAEQEIDLKQRAQTQAGVRHFSIREVLDLKQEEEPWITHRWLLRGDPGAGKTTLLRHLAWTLSGDEDAPWVPIFESLPRLMSDRLSVFGRIEEDLDRADQPGAEIRSVLEQEAKEGRLVLLLDGLDEVPREARGRAEILLSDLAARWPKSPIVVTTRPIGAWSPGAEFLELEVLPFDQERRLSFLERWFGEEGAERERAGTVASVLEVDRGLRELASNPLYLTLLALLIEGGDEPARYRARLFEQIFDLLEEGRHHKPPTPIDQREVAHEVLCGLAYRMTEDNRDAERVQSLEGRLQREKRLGEPLQVSWPRLRSFLDDVAEKTGILGPHDGPEADWRFWHRTFREALTAERMAEELARGEREMAESTWAGRLWHRLRGRGLPGLLRHARRIAREDLSRWAEPFALLAGRVEEPDALVQALVRANRALGLRAVATVQGLGDGTLREILELSEDWRERQKVYERLTELVDEPPRALALVDQLRKLTRDGNDLFFLEEAVREIETKWPEAGRAAGELRGRFYDHIPVPPAELLRWVETPLDGRVDLWRKVPAEEGWVGENPGHRVKIVRPYWLGSVPVTNAQYAAFDPNKAPRKWPDVPAHRLATHPRVNVTWYEAVSFCRWLSTLPGFSDCRPRLPIEEEWEVACRAGSKTRFWKGDDDKDLEVVGWYDKNSGSRTHRVGNKPANEVGLYDVHGNAWEWTSSPWQADRYAGRQGKVHPVDPADWPADLAESPRVRRVVRGGSCRVTAQGCRSAYRDSWVPGIVIRVLGFRVLLSSAPSGL